MARPEPPRLRVPVVPSLPDIDELGHVNNAVYIRWLQEAGTAHWLALASAEDQSRYIWVVHAHSITYRRPCHLGEALVAETWVDHPRGARFDRLVHILGPAGDLRADARTTWVLMDRETMRPQRIPAAMIRLFETVEPV
jgi:acyl-CoA thioester hydrolase